MKKLQVGGTLNPREHIYIIRQELEDHVFGLLSQGEYCNILSPRQVGKSSLVNSVDIRLRTAGIHSVYLDIAGELGSPAAPEVWYSGLLGKLNRELDLRLNLSAWRAEQTGTLRSCW